MSQDHLIHNRSQRVLIVEDDPVSAEILRKHFVMKGFVVDIETDGLRALRAFHRVSYRVVVSDWLLPGIDGIALCSEIRQLAGPDVYFILCSGKAQAHDRKRAYDAGVDDFLTKPIHIDELLPRMNAAKRILYTEDRVKRQDVWLAESAEELIQMDSNLTLAAQRFQRLFEGLPVACFTLDVDGHVLDWNLAAEQVFGISSEDAVGQSAESLLSTSVIDEWPAEKVGQLMASRSPGTFDWSFVTSEDRRYLASSFIAIADGDGSLSGICASVDVTERRTAEQRLNEYAKNLAVQTMELEAANRKLSYLAITDGLTGLWNHRRFHEVLSECVEQFNRDHETFSLIFLDIDYFKKVNDRLGHQEGDAVLRQFAHVLQENSRKDELPARYGGEEFAIILQHCKEAGSIKAAERFCTLIREYPWKHWTMTASFGVTTCAPGATVKTLITEADRALYAAKKAGRNRVMHWNAIEQNHAANETSAH